MPSWSNLPSRVVCGTTSNATHHSPPRSTSELPPAIASTNRSRIRNVALDASHWATRVATSGESTRSVSRATLRLARADKPDNAGCNTNVAQSAYRRNQRTDNELCPATRCDKPSRSQHFLLLSRRRVTEAIKILLAAASSPLAARSCDRRIESRPVPVASNWA